MSDIFMNKVQFAKALAIAPTTVQSYVVEIEKNGYKFKRDIRNGYQFSTSEFELFRSILDLQTKHKLTKKNAIIEALKNVSDISDMSGMFTTDISDMSNMLNISETISNMSKVMSDMSLHMSNMSEKMTTLENENKEIKKILTDRDKVLMETMRGIQEQNKIMLEIAATKERKWWQFWK